MAKTGLWLILMGAILAFLGVCFFPAAFGDNGDRNLLGAGSAVFAMGTLLISSGLYLKATLLKQQANASAGKTDAKPGKITYCDRCGEKEAAVQCRVHQVQMCPDCLREHYDFRSCAYVPSPRRMSQAAGA